MTLRNAQICVRYLVGLSFAWVGITHFTNPDPFVLIMPPFLPWHLALVYISGFFEIAGGLGLLYKPTRRMAGWGLLALLVAVYPANIHMLVNEVYLEGMPKEKWLLWARMPFQFVFALGVLWSANIWPRTSFTPPEPPSPQSIAEKSENSKV
tara:strand:- start:1489 stop:1944 length:456 start_codon:yes stop_codon:yes gene_type:complete